VDVIACTHAKHTFVQKYWTGQEAQLTAVAPMPWLRLFVLVLEGVPPLPLQILVSTKLPPPPSPPLLPQLVRRTDAQLQNSAQLLPKLMALHVSTSLASLRPAFPIALPLLANVESRSSHVLQDGRPAGRT